MTKEAGNTTLELDKEQYLHALKGLYGKVVHMQCTAIASAIHGKRILDVGAGLGTLSAHLIEQGYFVTAIDCEPQLRTFANELYEIEVIDQSIYETTFPDSSFDCVVLREVAFKLDFVKAMKEVNRLTRDQVIVFQPNNSFLRSLGHIIYGRQEASEHSSEYYIRILRNHGFKIEKVQYSDTLAFPLSGGFIGYQLVPRLDFLYSLATKCDEFLTMGFGALGLLPNVALRYLVSARKPLMVDEEEECEPSGTLSLELG